MANHFRIVSAADQVSVPGDAILLPDPESELLPPPEGDTLTYERFYFDPQKWDAETATRLDSRADDPVATGRGLATGHASAALFLSDFHIADGTAGGDDFLEQHLHPEDKYKGLYAGFFPPGESRAKLFLSVLTFAFRRVADRAGVKAALDIVLNGDVLNMLDLKGRGGTYVARCHAPFFRALAVVRERATVYWLRGNHDYVVPSGPWLSGEFYVNDALRTLAEHGDFWDKENWPPGPTNKGSRLVIELGSAFEVHPNVGEDGTISYLMSGVDNLRPWNNASVKRFLDPRSKYSDVAALSALLSRLKYVGAADDSAAYQGALQRRTEKYRDWLMVQGHTHVPAAVPGVYYNLGSWISTLLTLKGKESQIEAFPFLLVYLDPAGPRVEEYYVIHRDGPDSPAFAVLQSPDSVNELRKAFGYQNSMP